jgi:23S rRNA (adenine2503-C2)-methyltransferase
LQGVPAKVNLIYFNAMGHPLYERSSEEAVFVFQKILMNAGIRTLIRRSRGDDIAAACGQLIADVTL